MAPPVRALAQQYMSGKIVSARSFDLFCRAQRAFNSKDNNINTKIIVKDIHDCLAPVDQAYFRTSREQRLGRTLEEIEAQHAAELAAFQPKLEPVRHMLKFQPFLGGDGPLFADYILFGALQWSRVASPKRLLAADDPVGDWFERCLDLHDGRARQVMAA